MRHEYYYYNKEELLKNPKIPLIVMEDNPAVFRSMAEEMVEEIKRKNALGEKTVFICPVGPVGQYPYFVEMVNEQNISLKDVWFINMDEYLTDDKKWVPKDRSFKLPRIYGQDCLYKDQTGAGDARGAESFPGSGKFRPY